VDVTEQLNSTFKAQPEKWVIPDLDDDFFQGIRPLASALARFGEAADKARPDQRLPAASSMAMSDLATSKAFGDGWGDDPVDFLHSSAQMRLVVAEDLLVSLLKTVTSPPVSVFGGSVALRACLENAAITHRLLDPSIDARRRVARAYNELLYSFAEWAQLPDGTKPDNLVERQRKIEVAADACGMRLISKQRKPKSLEETRPSVTTAVNDLFDSQDLGKTTFKFLCAVAHGTQFGIAQSVRRVEDLPTSLGSGPMDAVNISVKQAGSTMGLALLGFGAATNREATYFGWESPERDTAWLAALSAYREFYTWLGQNPG
jgi:hypothetical protein